MPSCMRAPPDSMKPTTGTRARPASSQDAHDRVGVLPRPASRRANDGVLRVAERRPAVDAARRRRSRRRRRAPARPCGASARRCAAASSEPGSQSTSRRSIGGQPLVGLVERARAVMRPPGRARRCGRRSRTSCESAIGRLAVDAPAACARPGHVVEVEALARARSSRASAGDPRRAARGSSRSPRRRRRRRAGARSPTSSTRSGSSWRASPSAILSATVSARSLSGVEVPCALT